MPAVPTPKCREDPTYRPCVACERGMTVNVTYSFPDRQTVLCLCEKCSYLGFKLLPRGQLVFADDRRVTRIAA